MEAVDLAGMVRSHMSHIDLPLVGPALYRLNVSPPIIRHMAAEHVYTDRLWLRGERLRQKLAVTHAANARFSSVRFVTGKLDPLATRAEFLDLARRSSVPMLLVYGAETPTRSRAEMESLASITGVQTISLPLGKLSLHEEFPDLVSAAVEPFLDDSR